VGLRSQRGVAGLVGLSALACVLVVGSHCAMPVEPARGGWACRPLYVFLRFRCRVDLCVVAGRAWSGWARRPLCFHLRLPCGVGLHFAREASAEWLGPSTSLRSLVSSLWGRIALCSRGRCGVAGLVGLSALTCLPCGFGLHYGCVSASLRSLVSSLWGRSVLRLRSRRGVAGHVGLSAFVCVPVAGSDCAVCLFVCMYVAAAGAAARRASTCSSRRPESVCVRLPFLRPVSLLSALFLPPSPPSPGVLLSARGPPDPPGSGTVFGELNLA